MKIENKKIHFGAAYYPEHWSEKRWVEDVRLMADANFTVVRMGEFAWSTFEPAEGELSFEWMDRAVELLAEYGIATVMSTPTAAPPAWLTKKYPATLAVHQDGTKRQHGRRCHYCVSSPEYHAQVRHIVNAMAEYFGPNPNIIGWQLDNEYSTVCYCDTCRDQFRHYLANKFESLEALNEHWTTRYWSQSYTAWDQIPLPSTGHNPGLMLAFQQFVTHSYRKYQRIQLNELRPFLSEDVWITHNFMKWYPTYDHYELSTDLDMASWDWYVGSGHNQYAESGAAHDLVRGFKKRNFWLMETQPGNVNWSSLNNQLNKGESRIMAWHAFGHGADAVLYWQWRSALNGQEQYHGTLVDPSGQPRPFYEEASQIGAEFARISNIMSGSIVQARVAFLNDYDSRWSLDWSRQHQDFDYVQHFLHYYKPLAIRNIPIDILSADEALERKYRLVIAPGLVILTPERVKQLTEYLEKGGTLILTLRTGLKDQYNALLPMRQPGPLAKITNIEVEEYYPLDTPVPVVGNMIKHGTSRIWAERLRIIDDSKFTHPVARYGQHNGWLDDQIAISYNSYGRGGVYYVGAYLDEIAQARMLEYICDLNGVKPVLTTPRGIEACQRVTSDGKKVYILINHHPYEKTVLIPWSAHELLSGYSGKGQVTLEPYGVVLLMKTE
jgi:beta-galactosidase